MNWLKRLLSRPTPLELAAKELGELEHNVLEATGTRDWAQHRINYAKQRIAYLKDFLNTEVTT